MKVAFLMYIHCYISVLMIFSVQTKYHQQCSWRYCNQSAVVPKTNIKSIKLNIQPGKINTIT